MHGGWSVGNPERMRRRMEGRLFHHKGDVARKNVAHQTSACEFRPAAYATIPFGTDHEAWSQTPAKSVLYMRNMPNLHEWQSRQTAALPSARAQTHAMFSSPSLLSDPRVTTRALLESLEQSPSQLRRIHRWDSDSMMYSLSFLRGRRPQPRPRRPEWSGPTPRGDGEDLRAGRGLRRRDEAKDSRLD